MIFMQIWAVGIVIIIFILTILDQLGHLEVRLSNTLIAYIITTLAIAAWPITIPALLYKIHYKS